MLRKVVLSVLVYVMIGAEVEFVPADEAAELEKQDAAFAAAKIAALQKELEVAQAAAARAAEAKESTDKKEDQAIRETAEENPEVIEVPSAAAAAAAAAAEEEEEKVPPAVAAAAAAEEEEEEKVPPAVAEEVMLPLVSGDPKSQVEIHAEGSSIDLVAAEAESLVKKLKDTLEEESILLTELNQKLLDLQGMKAKEKEGGGGLEEEDVDSTGISRNLLRLATWNMAAINNNPFEYWITYKDEHDEDNAQAYEILMEKVSTIISEEPSEINVKVEDIFTDDMFEELIQLMNDADIVNQAERIEKYDQIREYWKDDLKQRKIISEFLKDPLLGKKRLISMPDRVTNTIQLYDGKTAPRPTVINCFHSKSIGTISDWWPVWKQFNFGEILEIDAGLNKKPIEMLVPIQKSKYPDITMAEELISIPLSALTLAIFDAVLIYMLASTAIDWQPIRSHMCQALNEQKNTKSASILESPIYQNMDIIFLQESSQAFITSTKERALATQYFDVHSGADADPSRDQNSILLTKKNQWTHFHDLTKDVLDTYSTTESKKSKNPFAPGDLVVYSATRLDDNQQYLLASFHGDTNGLATIPIIDLVHSYRKKELKDAILLFGLDANTHFNKETPKKIAYVGDFFKALQSHSLSSCYGLDPSLLEYTTFNARTYLQPQLNKAVKASEKNTSPLVDKNPKDFIVFYNNDFKVADGPHKDNTGTGSFIMDIVFPTLQFPSDHAITYLTLETKSS